METIRSEEVKKFTEEDEIQYKVERFKYCAREMEAYEHEMIKLCTDIISEHGISMESAIDMIKTNSLEINPDLAEQGIAD